MNVAVTADDYTPLAITNPLDGTPFTIYSQNAASIGRVDNVLLNSDLLAQSYDGGEVTVTRRFEQQPHPVRRRDGRQQQGGELGEPQPERSDQRRRLRSARLARHAERVGASTQLPWRVSLVVAPRATTRASRCAASTPVTRTIVPGAAARPSRTSSSCRRGEYRKPDQTLLDVRVGRRFRRATAPRSSRCVEVYNLLNENASLTEVEQVGPTLGRISRNIDGRLVRFSVRVGF